MCRVLTDPTPSPGTEGGRRQEGGWPVAHYLSLSPYPRVMVCSKPPTSPSATATQPPERSASCGHPPREKPSSSWQRWSSWETSERALSTPSGSYLPDCASIYFTNYLLPTQATKKYFFKELFSFFKFRFVLFFKPESLKSFMVGSHAIRTSQTVVYSCFSGGCSL